MSGGIADVVFGLFGTLLYPMFSVMFVLIYGIQYVFQFFAGIGNASFDNQIITAGNSGAEDDTGIVYFLMNNSLVKNMLGSIMLLAIVLIIIFTVMAFIKNAYSAKPKGWKDIVGNAIKGLANFIFVPVCALLGVWLGNILLNAINGATSYGGATSMDRKLFIACAYNANVFRSANAGTEEDAYKSICETLKLYGLEDQIHVEANMDLEYYATIVDQMYSLDRIPIHNHITVGVGITAHHGYYNLYQINYLVLIVGGIFILYVLCSLSFAMVRRLLLILVLFIISPGVCSLYPLDEGKALGSWKSEFIKQVLSAYGAVAGLNIFFSLVPLIDKINFGSSWSFQMNEFLRLFILVSGLLVVKELIALISGFVSGEDAYSKGTSLMASTRSAMKKYGGGAAKKVTGAFATGFTNFKERGFWGGLAANAKSAGNSLLDMATGVNLKKDIVDEWGDKSKAVKESAERDKKVGKAYESLDGKMDAKKKAESLEDKARENYLNLRDNRPAGLTDEEYKKQLNSARGKIGAAKKASNKAGKELNAAYATVREDLKGYSTEKLAKKLGISNELLSSSMTAGSEAMSLSQKHSAAQIDARAMVDALDLAAKRGDLSQAKNLGLDLGDLSSKLNKGIDDLINLFKGGVKFDVAELKTDDAKIAGTAFNRALDKQQAKEDKLSEAGKAYVDHLLAQNGKFVDSNGQVVEFKDSDIQQLKDALKTGTAEDVDATAIAKTVRDATRANENTIAKQLSSMKDIEKAIKDLNKKK